MLHKVGLALRNFLIDYGRLEEGVYGWYYSIGPFTYAQGIHGPEQWCYISLFGRKWWLG